MVVSTMVVSLSSVIFATLDWSSGNRLHREVVLLKFDDDLAAADFGIEDFR